MIPLQMVIRSFITNIEERAQLDQNQLDSDGSTDKGRQMEEDNPKKAILLERAKEKIAKLRVANKLL